MHTAKEKRKINLIVSYLPGNSWTCSGDELAVEHMGEWPMTWIGLEWGGLHQKAIECDMCELCTKLLVCYSEGNRQEKGRV